MTNLPHEWTLLSNIEPIASYTSAHHQRLLIRQMVARNVPSASHLNLRQLEPIAVKHILRDHILLLRAQRVLTGATNIRCLSTLSECFMPSVAAVVSDSKHVVLQVLVHAVQGHFVVVLTSLLLLLERRVLAAVSSMA